jgi:uncharacterized protein (DUF1778 family)
MPIAEAKRVDKKGRVAIPGLAGATVLVEQLSATEYRVRKAQVIPEDEITFLEEKPIVLSARDAEIFLAALDRPPRKPNSRLRSAVKRYKERHG